MAISYIGDGQYRGLSTDTKVAKPSGYTFVETDTGDRFISDGTYWWLLSLGALSNRRYGFLTSGSSTTNGTGMLSTLSPVTGTGTVAVAADSTLGRYTTYPTLTTTGNRGGHRITSTLAMRQWNSRLRVRFALVSTTLCRLYIGFMPNGEPTGDDPLNTLSGVLCGMISGSTNFQIMHNDSSGATVFIDTGVAIDALPHVIKIVADESNTRFAWSFDGSAYSNITADIPAATTALVFNMVNETNESGVAKTFRVYNAFIQSDL